MMTYRLPILIFPQTHVRGDLHVLLCFITRFPIGADCWGAYFSVHMCIFVHCLWPRCPSGVVPGLRDRADRIAGKSWAKAGRAMLFGLHLIIISNGAFQRTQTSTWLPSSLFGRVVSRRWPCTEVKDVFACYHTVVDKYGNWFNVENICFATRPRPKWTNIYGSQKSFSACEWCVP